MAADPVRMVEKLMPLKPLVGKECLERWTGLAQQGAIDLLFEAVMREHYDPCYERSTRKNYGASAGGRVVHLESLRREALGATVTALVST